MHATQLCELAGFCGTLLSGVAERLNSVMLLAVRMERVSLRDCCDLYARCTTQENREKQEEEDLPKLFAEQSA